MIYKLQQRQNRTHFHVKKKSLKINNLQKYQWGFTLKVVPNYAELPQNPKTPKPQNPNIRDMEKTGYEIGKKVVVIAQTNKGQHGVIKYFGEVSGLMGPWYGIELETATGKHDGKGKDGTQYFECKEKHGVWLREHQFSLAEQAKEKPPKKATDKADPKKKHEAKKTTKVISSKASKPQIRRLLRKRSKSQFMSQ